MKLARWGWLRLQIALSATALVVVLVRSGQIMRMSAETGAVALWRPIIATQAGFWIGWSLWTGVLDSARATARRTVAIARGGRERSRRARGASAVFRAAGLRADPLVHVRSGSGRYIRPTDTWRRTTFSRTCS